MRNHEYERMERFVVREETTVQKFLHGVGVVCLGVTTKLPN
jgi:hypothetical protein